MRRNKKRQIKYIQLRKPLFYKSQLIKKLGTPKQNNYLTWSKTHILKLIIEPQSSKRAISGWIVLDKIMNVICSIWTFNSPHNPKYYNWDPEHLDKFVITKENGYKKFLDERCELHCKYDMAVFQNKDLYICRKGGTPTIQPSPHEHCTNRCKELKELYVTKFNEERQAEEFLLWREKIELIFQPIIDLFGIIMFCCSLGIVVSLAILFFELLNKQNKKTKIVKINKTKKPKFLK